MTILGIIIIIAVVGVLICLFIGKYDDNYAFEYSDDLFGKKHNTVRYKQKMLQTYALEHGYLEPVKKIIAPVFNKYIKDIYSEANNREMREACIKALKYMEDLFEDKEKEIIKNGSVQELKDLVIDCYGSYVFNLK